MGTSPTDIGRIADSKHRVQGLSDYGTLAVIFVDIWKRQRQVSETSGSDAQVSRL